MTIYRSRINHIRHKDKEYHLKVPNIPGYLALYNEDDRPIYYAKTNNLRDALHHLEKDMEYAYFSIMESPSLQLDTDTNHSNDLILSEFTHAKTLKKTLRKYHKEHRNIIDDYMKRMQSHKSDEEYGLSEKLDKVKKKIDEEIDDFGYTYYAYFHPICKECINKSFCIKRQAIQVTSHPLFAYPTQFTECEMFNNQHPPLTCPVCHQDSLIVNIVNRFKQTHTYEIWCKNCSWKGTKPFKFGFSLDAHGRRSKMSQRKKIMRSREIVLHLQKILGNDLSLRSELNELADILWNDTDTQKDQKKHAD